MRFDQKTGKPLPQTTCPYQPGGGVLCTLSSLEPERCNTCGWNPEVAARRSEALRERVRSRVKK